MLYTWDEAKSERNARERGLPFKRASAFEWDRAIVWQDVRKIYPETRMVALGPLDSRLHVICFTLTDTGLRIISLRKANAREVKRYETQTAD